ncbi:MAG TPA: hypothetical protein VFP17_04285 [Solirubrobacterales bacterium]|nr:hypothetical protein [Solirubrobacterales bacterium]
MALGALIAVSLAGIATAGNTPVTVKQGNLEFTFNGGFSPTTLPKNKLAPISLQASGSIKTLDGTHPPALKEVVLETDKNGAINTKGIPVCTSGKLQARDTKAAEKVCGKSIIGTGQTKVEVQFPEQRPVIVDSKLLVINGGTSGGKTTLFIHAYFSAPVTGAIVTTVKIKKVHNGRYGLKSVATIPKIANGAGSVLSFNLTINKKGVLTAKCPDGKLQAHATSIFADGTKASAGIVRTCKGK